MLEVCIAILKLNLSQNGRTTDQLEKGKIFENLVFRTMKLISVNVGGLGIWKVLWVVWVDERDSVTVVHP